MGGKNDGRFSVIYLLDVNALMGLGFSKHVFHDRVESWLESMDQANLATCAITELGFVRILAQLPDHEITVEFAQEMLALLKATSRASFTFLVDDVGVDLLPKWVKNPGQTTDGHLAALAKAHGATLATLDRKIHGAFLIPA
jgi:predicted nucleic acid-binding protein